MVVGPGPWRRPTNATRRSARRARPIRLRTSASRSLRVAGPRQWRRANPRRPRRAKPIPGRRAKPIPAPSVRRANPGVQGRRCFVRECSSAGRGPAGRRRRRANPGRSDPAPSGPAPGLLRGAERTRACKDGAAALAFVRPRLPARAIREDSPFVGSAMRTDPAGLPGDRSAGAVGLGGQSNCQDLTSMITNSARSVRIPEWGAGLAAARSMGPPRGRPGTTPGSRGTPGGRAPKRDPDRPADSPGPSRNACEEGWVCPGTGSDRPRTPPPPAEGDLSPPRRRGQAPPPPPRSQPPDPRRRARPFFTREFGFRHGRPRPCRPARAIRRSAHGCDN